ncbi:MAG: MFS transporter [Lentimicrobium sp.]|jgi:GPH family glycoside/pentoside/hexuronide:cation symporter|nr:MFS transporter [Lentimicrobium sp.]
MLKDQAMPYTSKVSIKEKIGYALGDGAANIAWRGVATFLFVFYTDVFGISPVAVGMLMLVARFSDGISDVLMGIIGDRTKSKYGKFRPWILWTAIPLGIVLSLLFTTPDLGSTGKIVYAYITYILFTLIYTANNIPYGALMAVITGDDKERTVLGSYRMVGAFAGGMIVQGALLFLVVHFGNVNPEIKINQLGNDRFLVTASVKQDIDNVNIKTKDGIAVFLNFVASPDPQKNVPTSSVSFTMKADSNYVFLVEGEKNLVADKISIIDQKKGYSNSIYIMSAFLAFFMFITFYSTRERVQPPKSQETNLKKDLKDLINNKPWLVLLVIGLLFNVYNAIKQGIVVIYFTHYLNDQLLAGSYLVGLMLASIAGAMVTGPLGKKFGKRNLFIYALIFSSVVNMLIILCGPGDIVPIYLIGMVSEFAAAIFPTLFFAMLGDAADYSEYKNGRRATGLVYSAGSFATKFGGGLAGAIIGMMLGFYNYNGQDSQSIQGAIPAIKMLMSWVPALIALLAAALMTLYPLTQQKMSEITLELSERRLKE